MSTSKGRAADKVVIVTGSTRGVGKGIAKVLAAEGAKVVVCGRNQDNGAQTVADIKNAGGEASFFKMDITQEQGFIDVVDFTVKKYGKLTTMINNAAGTDPTLALRDGPVTEIELSSWDALLRADLTSVFLGCKHSVRQMIKQGEGGTVINVSSLSGISSHGGHDAYAASKAGVNALTRVMANTYSQSNIRTNGIGLGFVPTENPVHQKVAQNPEIRKAFFTRLGTPADVGHLCVYLATEESGFLTGATIPLDGGASIKSLVPGIEHDPTVRP